MNWCGKLKKVLQLNQQLVTDDNLKKRRRRTETDTKNLVKDCVF